MVEEKGIKIATTASEITIKQLTECESIINDETTSELDRYIRIIQVISNLTIEVIEDYTLDEVRELVELVINLDLTIEEADFKNEIIIDGITYRNKSVGFDNIKLSFKEMMTIKEYYATNNTIKLNELAAIIFRKVGDDGVISRDLRPEIIKTRSKIFENMTIDYILPYVNSIKSQL